MVTTREDIHRPSAAEFDPEAYFCAGVFDLHPEFDGFEIRSRREAVDIQIAQGRHFAAHQQNGQCGHCGARIRYVALMVHTGSNEMIWVGETCLDNRFEALTKGEFQALRKAAALDRERQARLAAFDALLDEHPELVYLTYLHNVAVTLPGAVADRVEWSVSTSADILHKVRRYGSVSDKQVALLVRISNEFDAKVAEVFAKAAEREAELANTPDLAEGRYEIEGVVLTIREQRNDYSPYGGIIFKMLVKRADGTKVWGSVPSSINAWKGDTVRFTAAVKRSDDDRTFGFYSRPTKASIVAEGPRDSEVS